LPLDALEEPDEINRFKTDFEYAEDVEIATIHRALETLRAAMSQFETETVPPFSKGGADGRPAGHGPALRSASFQLSCPLDARRKIVAMTSLRVGVILLGCTAVFAQDLRPSFDAASVRPAAPAPVGPFWPGSRPVCPLTGCGGPGTGSPERITFTYVSLKHLIEAAYDVRSYQIEAPAWLESARFDVVANVPPGATRDQANLMLQNLLADRFQLKLHRSTRELPVYALVVAKNDPKLKESVDDPNAPRGRGTIGSGARKRFEFDGQTMARFADVLASEVDRPVIDMTGLEGTYDIRLEFAPQSKSAFGSPNPQDTPELFTALTEQLGLKLESRKGPVVLLVVDSASRQPTEN
jgi:uncharacterized protein (TIGR03435 family)